MRRRVGLLSYATVRPDNLRLLRESADDLDVELLEVEPHALVVRVDGAVRVEWEGEPLDGSVVDVVLHRTVQRHLNLVVPALQALSAAGTPVVNDPAAAVTSRNKLATLALLAVAGLPVAPTWAGFAAPRSPPWPAAVLVAKPSLGVRGEDVRLVQTSALAGHWREESLLGPTLLQPVIGPGRDCRAYVVDGRCVAAARRRSTSDDFRSNASLGADVEPLEPAQEAAVAGLAERAVAALGLDVAAVDLLEDDEGGLHLSEVDAWGGFAHLQQALGVPVARHVLAAALLRVGG